MRDAHPSRGRREHRAWVHANADALSEAGLPLRVFETKERWADFVENGHLHFHEDGGRFSVEQLTEAQRMALHTMIERSHGQVEPVPRLLSWLRARRAPPKPSLPTTGPDAIAWLASRGAHPWLVRHHALVLEAAGDLVHGLLPLLPFDAEHVLLGAALHDAGKVEHPEEMQAPGHAHEAAGEQLLLRSGFAAHVARACVTHAAWSEPRAMLEDRLIALADKLWKGKRDAALESALVEELAARTGRASWEVFADFDALCERIADAGPDRLRRAG